MKVSKLSLEQQIDRFGMTFEQAVNVRDRAEVVLSDKDKKLAREAWQALSYELRGNKSGPMVTVVHPEAVRVRMLELLAAGETIEEARNGARAYAHGEVN